ncbi:L-ectoine synthase [Reichenbachiella sp. 5M10]|uniref:ectoine synthase n=1 Tax=Reichenbachiella sp. 5M10 TaxID=1889772 RepID=UPI000C1625C5|nr:ectoine synthase [Reichenbachiella sp. 5M10]PIB36968.1 L-ectoine synthase [Reichenbachiella sp. 5M10]
MIVRTREEVVASGNEVVSEGWTSRRYLLKKDQMGFSFHETIISKGAQLKMHYKNHLEAVFCVKGQGKITALATGESWDIQPGTMYALNENDKHILEGITEMTVMCVFNPPVTGQEKHNPDGSYSLVEEDTLSV